MRFWDSSAIVPLVCREKETLRILGMYKRDMDILVWAFTRTEVLSALCRRAREGSLSHKGFDQARTKVLRLAEDWTENVDYERVRDRADRLLNMHALSAGDALQLAAALSSVEERTQGFGFVTLDARLADAAAREGFSLI